jgi:hypothetical protein
MLLPSGFRRNIVMREQEEIEEREKIGRNRPVDKREEK